jgi:hypothetical protein
MIDDSRALLRLTLTNRKRPVMKAALSVDASFEASPIDSSDRVSRSGVKAACSPVILGHKETVSKEQKSTSLSGHCQFAPACYGPLQSSES